VRCRLIKPALHCENISEVVVRFDKVGLEDQGPSNHIDRDIVAARLPGEHAEKMKAVDVAGVERTDSPVTGLGLGQSAGLVVRDRRGKPICNLR
jgi:hypothetical protein